jgi:sulfoxide reductase catalytic subunit YedY
MLIKRPPNGIDIPFSSEITPRHVFEARRRFIKALAVGSIASASLLEMAAREAFAQTPGRQKLPAQPNPAYKLEDKLTDYEDATTYNNFYEFGTGKGDPARYADSMKTRPWVVSIEGEVNKPMQIDIDTLLKMAPLEERVYRLRCVEGWSMVIPWIGYSFSALMNKVQPNGHAKFVEFTTLADNTQMPNLKSRVLHWPYVEGLRLDEANHPLTLLCMGMYGEVLPNQNGAPVRIIVPWKYGFKSAKSIVKIRFTREQPRTAWNMSAPNEYGFYSNVNPNVRHPRWSQAKERRIGEGGLFARRRDTLMFNGYEQVASLYSGMDLKRFY